MLLSIRFPLVSRVTVLSVTFVSQSSNSCPVSSRPAESSWWLICNIDVVVLSCRSNSAISA
ncbi:hypothetical protein GBAR_LOCUS1417, partial [Geodia barretti]